MPTAKHCPIVSGKDAVARIEARGCQKEPDSCARLPTCGRWRYHTANEDLPVPVTDANSAERLSKAKTLTRQAWSGAIP